MTAYNSIDNEYLVVWEGDDDIDPLVEGEQEIFGQRIDAATGAEIGANDFRISHMGPDGDTNFEAGEPAVAYNSVDNLYLVVWEGDDDTGVLVDNEFETWGQLIDAATGETIGVDIRISDMGPDADTEYDAGRPAVAFNPVSGEYLVVWRGEDDAGGLVFDEFEIYGQRISAELGGEVGVNDFRISDMGSTDGDTDFTGESPAVAHNPTTNEYLVVWSGDDDSNGLVVDELEIYGQLLDGSSGAEIGVNDFRISDMGPDGDPSFVAEEPSVAYNAVDDDYLVGWEANDDNPALSTGEFEIYAQRIDAAGSPVGANDLRVSHMGTDGESAPKARNPSIAYDSVRNEYLVAFNGDDATGGLVDNENEIYSVTIARDPVCGNGVIETGEDCTTCPEDVQCAADEECVAGVCSPLCGNGVVDPGEDCANCPQDVHCPPFMDCIAGICEPLCDNGVIDVGEHCGNCPENVPCPPGTECIGTTCELLCGNGTAEPGEDCANCPQDIPCPPGTECVKGMCVALCGNGTVDPGEDCETCPLDVPCPPGTTCVNGLCVCPWDLDGDGTVGITDFLELLANWGPCS